MQSYKTVQEMPAENFNYMFIYFHSFASSLRSALQISPHHRRHLVGHGILKEADIQPGQLMKLFIY